MSFNGSGTFQINTAGQPVVSGTVISSTAFNALTADLATGLSTCITKDGQTTVTANIPMATFKFTGLGAGSAATDSANLSQVQSTVVKLLGSVSGADTITAVGSPVVTAYAAGQMFYFVAAGANTTTVTLNIDGLGAKAVTRDGATALAAGDIQSGEVCVVVYDGTRFQLINAANSFGNTTINGTLTVTGNTNLQANVSITSALNVGGVATFTSNPILSGGTANGVLYLNGSKAATSGSAVTYNGTTFSTSADASLNGLTVGRGAGAVSTNTAVGSSALASNTTGANNVALGYNTLAQNTSGGLNIAIGRNALYSNLTTNNNTAVGYSALFINTGSDNSAFGFNALYSNQTGSYNTAIGDQALYSNTTASNNTAVGYQAAYANTTGTYNTAVGYASFDANTTGSGNTAVGYNAIGANTAGADNSAFGYGALGSGNAGSSNTAIGRGVLSDNTGNNNTAVGYYALIQNSTAGNNTAVGFRAGYSNLTGTALTIVGYDAGYLNTASNNTFVGMYSGYNTTSGASNTFVGYASGHNVTGGTGGFNTFIGESSGSTMTSGAKNTILGRFTGNTGALDIRTSSNFIVFSDGDGNPRGWFDASGYFHSEGFYNITTASAANMNIDSDYVVRRSTSSLRYKTDVKNATHGLAEVLALRPVTYKGINDGDKVFGGLIAEEVHDAGLTEFVMYNKDGQPDALAYGNMVSVLVKAIQELKAEFDAYKASHP